MLAPPALTKAGGASNPAWWGGTIGKVNFSDDSSLFERIHAALPQTQCTRCGYPDCAAYAQAIACGQATINQCPPGGAEGVQRLARITGQPIYPLNPAHGAESARAVAVIDEAWCIGCTLCLKACPVDAIMGRAKLMHTVIETDCTGCELCVPVCPVDCISLENVTGTRTGWNAWSQSQAEMARRRYEAHQRRLGQKDRPLAVPEQAPEDVKALEKSQETRQTLVLAAQQVEGPSSAAERKRAMIEAALARSRALREQKP